MSCEGLCRHEITPKGRLRHSIKGACRTQFLDGSTLQPHAIWVDFDDLINASVLRNVEVVLSGNGWRQEASTDKVSTLEVFDEWFRSRQANERCWHEGTAQPGTRGAVFNVPRRRSIHRRYRNLRPLQSFDNGREWFPDFSGEAKAEDCVNDVVGASESG